MKRWVGILIEYQQVESKTKNKTPKQGLVWTVTLNFRAYAKATTTLIYLKSLLDKYAMIKTHWIPNSVLIICYVLCVQVSTWKYKYLTVNWHLMFAIKNVTFTNLHSKEYGKNQSAISLSAVILRAGFPQIQSWAAPVEQLCCQHSSGSLGTGC